MLLGAALLGTSCGPEGNPLPSIAGVSQRDAESLRGAGAQWDRLFNARDAAGLAALYAENVVSMPFNAGTLHGRKALQADFETFFLRNRGRHETIVEEILAHDDWAIERARYVLGYEPVTGGERVVESGRHVVCRKKADGRWQIAWEIWNTDTPVRK